MRLNTRPKPKPAARRRRPKTNTRRGKARQTSLLSPAVARVLLAGTILLPLGLGATWLWTSGAIGRFADSVGNGVYNMTAAAGLAVEDVLVEGRDRSGTQSILAALDVARGTPILKLDPEAAKARLEALPWVKSAEVARRLPDILHLRLEERRPLALWQVGGELSVIDQDGLPIPGAQPQRFAKLPLVVGEDAPEHVRGLLSMLASQPDLAPKVVAAVRVSGRRWNLQLDGGVDVRLPEEAPEAAWAKLARVQREQDLLEHDVVMIDLRIPDRLVVRSSTGQVPVRPDALAGKNT
jgi:cell division protein FtsQ